MNEVRFSNYFIEKRTSHFWGALLYKVFPYGFAVFISHFFSDGDHTDDLNGGANGGIDPADEDHEVHSNGGNCGIGSLPQQIQQVAAGEKKRREHRG